MGLSCVGARPRRYAIGKADLESPGLTRGMRIGENAIHGPASDFWTGPCQPSALLDPRVRSDVRNGMDPDDPLRT